MSSVFDSIRSVLPSLRFRQPSLSEIAPVEVVSEKSPEEPYEATVQVFRNGEYCAIKASELTDEERAAEQRYTERMKARDKRDAELAALPFEDKAAMFNFSGPGALALGMATACTDKYDDGSARDTDEEARATIASSPVISVAPVGHIVTFGRSGWISGNPFHRVSRDWPNKTDAVMIPATASWPFSKVVLDPRGDLRAAASSNPDPDHVTYVVGWREEDERVMWNEATDSIDALAWVRMDEHLFSDLEILVETIIPEISDSFLKVNLRLVMTHVFWLTCLTARSHGTRPTLKDLVLAFSPPAPDVRESVFAQVQALEEVGALSDYEIRRLHNFASEIDNFRDDSGAMFIRWARSILRGFEMNPRLLEVLSGGLGRTVDLNALHGDATTVILGFPQDITAACPAAARLAVLACHKAVQGRAPNPGKPTLLLLEDIDRLGRFDALHSTIHPDLGAIPIFGHVAHDENRGCLRWLAWMTLSSSEDVKKVAGRDNHCWLSEMAVIQSIDGSGSNTLILKPPAPEDRRAAPISLGCYTRPLPPHAIPGQP